MLPIRGRLIERVRAGVTLLELLVVVAIVGIMAGLGLPRLTNAKERANLSAAKDQVQAALSTARAAAIRQGYPAQFHAEMDSVWVTAASGSATGPQVVVGPVAKLRASGVSMTTSSHVTLIEYDGRGFANLVGSGKIWVTVGSRTDSVCITRLGSVMKGGCL